MSRTESLTHETPLCNILQTAILIALLAATVEAVDTVVSADNGSFRVEYELIDRGRFGHRLTVGIYRDSGLVRTTKTYIRHGIYRVCTGDINGNGITDICIGVVKKTPFDPVTRKRLFIYTHRSGVIAPLWMGSKVGHNLQDFLVRVTGLVTIIRTVEENPGGSFSVGEYTWQSFGLSWKRYLERGIDREQAYRTISE